MHYAIGDIHGCFKELKLLLEKIESKDVDAKFYFVGDWIDRGKNVPQVMQWVVDHITLDGKYQSVRGNHDQEALDWYHRHLIPWSKKSHTFSDSVPNTYYDFNKVVEEHFNSDPLKLAPFFNKVENVMPLNKRLNIKTASGKTITYRLCHGWHCFNTNVDQDYMDHTNLYTRNYMGNFENDEVIVHGHTPTFVSYYTSRGIYDEERPGMIGYRHNAINLDGGCCYFEKAPESVCMLCGICLETLEEFYHTELEERIKEAAELTCVEYHIKKYEAKKTNQFRKEMLSRIYGD